MGLLRLYSKVTLTKSDGGEYVFKNYINQFDSDGGVEDLTDTCKITFPRSGKFKGRNLFASPNPIFEIGDQIKVELGYYPNLETVFEGWVSNISAKIPCEIECEDDMWLLKNTNVTFPSKAKQQFQTTSLKKHKPLKHPRYIGPEVTLKELLSECMAQGADDIDFDAVDCNLGLFRATNCSIARILDELRSKYGLYSYFIDHVLHCGLPYNAAKTKTHLFVFDKVTPWSVIDDSGLEYKLAKDIKIKVVAKLLGLNNTWEEVTVGDSDGAQRTFFSYWSGKGDKPDLTAFANLKLREGKYDGFQGTFETFGYKYVEAGDIVQFESTKLPERNGAYLVKRVQRSFGMNGYRQSIELGMKVG